MSRLAAASLLFAATLGWSGCLLFTDPINKAPVVTFDAYGTVYRGVPTPVRVSIRDDDGPYASFQVRWHDFGATKDEGCDWITPAEWATLPPPGPDVLLARDAPFSFTASTLAPTCLCARASDSRGAYGQACRRVDPQNPIPTAVLTDLGGAAPASQQPKCSPIRLSAERSQFSAGHPDLPFPVGDDVRYLWSLTYEGPDPMGKLTPLTDCADSSPSRQGAHRCLRATVPGAYLVTLTVTDAPDATAPPTASAPASVRIAVAEDKPACLLQTSPELGAKWILLARSASLGGRYEARTFTVSSVKDDCEPYPPRDDAPSGQGATFVWSVMDGTQGKKTWEVQANPANANAFTIDQQSFPNARPGDTIGLRVEVRDTTARYLHETVGPACADSTLGICCGSSGCTGANDCIRWTTWTVQFQP